MTTQPTAPTLHDAIQSISTPFTGILLDAYGVFWGGNAAGAFPGSRESMAQLVSQGKIIGILSNSTQLSEKEIEKIKQHGLLQNKHFHFYITSGQVTRNLLQQRQLPFPTPRNSYWVFGEDHPNYTSQQAIFENTGYHRTDNIQEADFIYIATPHLDGKDQENLDVFKEKIYELLPYQLPMLCANPDRFAHEGHPARSVVRQGSIAQCYEQLGGKVFYIGKPEKILFETALQKFMEYNITDSEKILMVGDTPETDIVGAHTIKIKSALVTETGMMSDRIREKGLAKAVAEYLAGAQRPDYLIKKL